MTNLFRNNLMLLAVAWLLARISPLSNRTTYGFDAARRPVRTQDANLNITTTVFDPANRPCGNGGRHELPYHTGF